jgi:hypothetical protein
MQKFPSSGVAWELEDDASAAGSQSRSLKGVFHEVELHKDTTHTQIKVELKNERYLLSLIYGWKIRSWREPTYLRCFSWRRRRTTIIAYQLSARVFLDLDRLFPT